MMGCCGAQRTKFKTKEGKVVQQRLDIIITEKKALGWDANRIEILKRCDCPCHTEGVNCMC